jgi:ABC-type molybdenum transport system ATPase subunit/photorepair protein PhrA
MGRDKKKQALQKAGGGVVEKEKEKLVLSPWSGTGVLASLPTARDLKIDKFSVSMHGTELIKDTLLELSHGRRYGLIGLNGTGKTVRLCFWCLFF